MRVPGGSWNNQSWSTPSLSRVRPMSGVVNETNDSGQLTFATPYRTSFPSSKPLFDRRCALIEAKRPCSATCQPNADLSCVANEPAHFTVQQQSPSISPPKPDTVPTRPLFKYRNIYCTHTIACCSAPHRGWTRIQRLPIAGVGQR